MSSSNVRTLVKDFLTAEIPSETVVDLTAQFDDVKEMLTDQYSLQPDAPWLGIDFQGDTEEPVSLSADNEKGLYREFGQIQLHICAMAKIGVGASLLARAEVLRNLFRGRRIEGIVVESVSPLNTGPGATLEFENGYVSGTVIVAYHFDLTPGI